jgi:hypothetical protein
MKLNLKGLTAAPSQVCGAIRLVPLLRDTPCEDVRLGVQHYGNNNYATVQLPDKTQYSYFVPHGLILRWTNEGCPVVANGGSMNSPKGTFGEAELPFFARMVQKGKKGKKNEQNVLRFLPLHLALEGFLALAFGGPDILWKEYSRYAKRNGLGMRSEAVSQGKNIDGLSEALRVFEIHEGQVGIMLFVAEALATVFVVPAPEDYKRLHESLLLDFYGEIIEQYALYYDETIKIDAKLHVENAKNITDIRHALTDLRVRWSDFTQHALANEIWGQEVTPQSVYKPGNLALSRFVTDLNPAHPNHIGEMLTRPDGEMLYLKTFTLSAGATRRAYLLKTLAENEWNLDDAALAFGQTREAFITRLDKAGFGYLLKPDVLAIAHRAMQTNKKSSK